MTTDRERCELRAVHGETCETVCDRWLHRPDLTDAGLSYCSFCLAVRGQPAGLCATMTHERPLFGSAPKPQGPCVCGTHHTPPISDPAPPVPYMGAVA